MIRRISHGEPDETSPDDASELAHKAPAARAEAAKIQLDTVGKLFGHGEAAKWAIREVSLEIEPGEFVALLGPSGCGKSTLLHLIAGLLVPTQGAVRYDGVKVTGVNTRVGYVTQRDNLLPWRTVTGNIALPLELAGTPKVTIQSRVEQMINRVGLAGFADHYPQQLSGGMRKRASLARTLIYATDTWLMDEPFAALDAQLKLILQQELLRLWEESGSTVLYVTHDIREAIALSDRVVVLGERPGRIVSTVISPFPRPRDILQLEGRSAFQRLYNELWAVLKPSVELR